MERLDKAVFWVLGAIRLFLSFLDGNRSIFCSFHKVGPCVHVEDHVILSFLGGICCIATVLQSRACPRDHIHLYLSSGHPCHTSFPLFIEYILLIPAFTVTDLFFFYQVFCYIINLIYLYFYFS
jgi:hypothetical protein